MIFLIISIILIIFILFVFPFFYSIWEYKSGSYEKDTGLSYFETFSDTGKAGEYKLYNELRIFEKTGSKFLFNLYIPKINGQFSETDMIMICSKGIIVFESKNYSGWIFGTENHYKWMQTFSQYNGECKKQPFYNPIRQNNNHIYALRRITGNKVPLFSVIAFSDDCELKKITLYSNTIVDNYRNIRHRMVKDILKNNPDILSPDMIENLYENLYVYTQVNEDIKSLHQQKINEINDKRRTEIYDEDFFDNYTNNEENSEIQSIFIQTIKIIFIISAIILISFYFLRG